MKIQELLEDVTPYDLGKVEQIADALWAKFGVDVKFTRHFLDRVNDERNKTPITTDELIALFKKEFKNYGREISDLDSNAEAVMKDMFSKINLPFVVTDRGRERSLVAKTVMRKDRFQTPNPSYVV